MVQRLLVAFDSIRRHRGNTQGRLAQALSFALSAAMRQGSRAFGPALNQVEPRADAPVFSPAPAAAAAVHPPIVVPVDAFTLAQSESWLHNTLHLCILLLLQHTAVWLVPQ